MAGGYRASRRRYLLASLAGAASVCWPARGAQPVSYAEDYRKLVTAIDSRYAYFDDDVSRSWQRARNLARQRLAAARTRAAFGAVVHDMLAGLRDDHVSVDLRRPVRRVPAETDLWARWDDGAATIEAVRIGSEADSVGLVPGDRVIAVQDVGLESAVDRLLPDRPFAAARDWAVRHLLAGPWSGPFSVEVEKSRNGTRRLELQRQAPGAAADAPLHWRRIGERRDLAYLRLPAMLDGAFVEALDALLARIGDARTILLDLRDVNGMGSPEAVRAVLGRFVEQETGWQIRVARKGKDGRRSLDVAAPEGARTGKPVVALVDRWTAGSGEALAAGLMAAGAKLVGTPMAGLRGVLGEIHLPASDLRVRFPVERALLADGTPREALRPHVMIDLATPSAGPGDPILYEALKAAT